MNYSEFTNQFTLSKTLRFKLIPLGNTLENVKANEILEKDLNLKKCYPIVKRLIDENHKRYIERVLSENKIFETELENYTKAYYSAKESPEAKETYSDCKAAFCKSISNLLASDGEYKTLSGKELVSGKNASLLELASDRDEEEAVKAFDKFSTYFTGFYENRANMYSDEEKSTGIANRIVNDNLPKFFDNVKAGEKILKTLPKDTVKELNGNFEQLFGIKIEDILSEKYAGFVFSQSEIDKYNSVVGGYTLTDGTKIQGINEKVNLFNQLYPSNRLPKLKMLFKQILSDRETVSFVPEEFADDDEFLCYVTNYVDSAISSYENIKNCLQSFDASGVFADAKYVSGISQKVFGDWRAVSGGITDGKNDFYSLSEIEEAGKKGVSDVFCEKYDIRKYYADKSAELYACITNAVADFKTVPYPHDAGKRIAKNGEEIEKIKALMDALKDFQTFVKPIYDGRNADGADEIFYGEFVNHYENITGIVKLYDRARNHITKKPFSTEKFKLNFDNPMFLSGWDINKEKEYKTTILESDGKYYLMIFKNPSDLTDYPDAGLDEKCYNKMVYRQIPNSSKYFSSKQINPQNPPKDVAKILEKKKNDPKSLSPKEIARFIDYIQNDFMVNYPYLKDKNGTPFFNFVFKKPSEYEKLNDFFIDIDKQAYVLKFGKISKSYIDGIVGRGDGYLFEIYSKDFSDYSKGTKNLHTLYFNMLFDDKNKQAGIFKLSGGAEMFYRPASLKLSETTIHKKNVPIDNKNALNDKKTSTFDYDIIKDRRYTEDQFFIHVPIQINFNSKAAKSLNEPVRKAIRNEENQYVIGIDRGERNLIYVSVIDGAGNIVHQESMNVIENTYNGNSVKTDYNALLKSKAKDRMDARKNWQSVTNIKELKEGYLSQAVHKICGLAVRYNAIIVMENLNVGFKNARMAVENSVYQKFETMLANKLSFLCDKAKDPDDEGGILKAYQLALPTTSFNDLKGQNGIVFYVRAWLTSKIDPATGFVNRLYPKYVSIEKSKEFIGGLGRIEYRKDCGMFSFEIENGKWTVWTNGERIETFRNHEKLNQWDTRVINLTTEFKNLFDRYGIDENGDIKTQILSQTDKAFFVAFIKLFNLTLQMRNSVPNTDIDYMISPVKNKEGKFYDSRDAVTSLPIDADANGAYNIARKGLILVDRIKKASDLSKVELRVTDEEWLEYAEKMAK